MAGSDVTDTTSPMDRLDRLDPLDPLDPLAPFDPFEAFDQPEPTDVTWGELMNHDDGSKTTPLSMNPEAMRRLQPPRAALLFYHHEGNTVVTLAAGESAVVGRSRPADVALPDRSLSRTHARFTFDGAAVTVEDLSSTNGSFVNGERMREAQVGPGDELRIGTVVVVLHLVAGGEQRPQGIDSLERLRDALSAELVRARHFARPVSLLVVASSKDLHVGAFAPAVQQLLRKVDRAAMVSPHVLALLLPELELEGARTVADKILAARKDAVMGLAVYPSLCGGTGDEMIDAARAALEKAREGGRFGRHALCVVERSTPHAAPDRAGPVVKSTALKAVFDRVDKLAGRANTVLLRGETGVGKEVVAQALHQRGPRAKRPLVCLNCAALPPTLVESILFGTKKGVFTEAIERKGVFEEAHGGTVFLDEVGELPLEIQAKLLRVLENKRVTRLGDTQEVEVDVRIVAATNQNLEEMCAAGMFRADLRYRLDGSVIEIPPLRQRREEILELARRFLRGADDGRVQDIDEEAQRALLEYDWPGNVRQLKNAMENAAAIAAGPQVSLDDLPGDVRRALKAEPLPERQAERGERAERAERAERTERGRTGVTRVELPPAAWVGRASAERGRTSWKALRRASDAQVLIEALERNGGNQTRAAEDLQMPLRTLVHKLKELGVRKQAGGYTFEAEPAPSMGDDDE